MRILFLSVALKFSDISKETIDSFTFAFIKKHGHQHKQ